jgi:hypothetical protein
VFEKVEMAFGIFEQKILRRTHVPVQKNANCVMGYNNKICGLYE